MTAPEFVSRLGPMAKPKANGAGWLVCCPAHDDKKPSLSVTSGADGRVLLHCHAGCSPEAIVAACGLKMSDLFPPGTGGTATTLTPHIIDTYDYVNTDGTLVFQVVRYEPKGFRQRRPDPDKEGGWLWNLNGVERVLFRLPAVIKAVAEHEPIFVAEGEKDADALVKAGCCATCNSGGAGKWQDSYTATLKGAQVVVIPDKDAPGRKHAQAVATALNGTAAGIKVIELPDLDRHPVKDASDWLAFGGQTSDLKEIVRIAPEWTAASATRQLQTIEPGSLNSAMGNVGRIESGTVAAEYLGPEAATLPAKIAGTSATDKSETLVARPLFAIPMPSANNPDELLRHNYLCRGGGMLLAAPTGVGKSSFVLQAAITWGLGRDHFGIGPPSNRPIKTLILQAENDDQDITQMREGIATALRLSDADRSALLESVWIHCESGKMGLPFFSDVARPLLEKHQPDIIVVDPVFAYLGANASDQEKVSQWLRSYLAPLLREFKCAAILVHHTNKPLSGREKPNWQAGDFAYLGSGSNEWANWPRAVLAISSVGSHSIFKLHAAKRGARLHWRNEDGSTSFERMIAHAKEPGSIFWRGAESDEVTTGGRPKSYNVGSLVELLPQTGSQPQTGKRRLKRSWASGKPKCWSLEKSAQKNGKAFHSKVTKRWTKVPNTKPESEPVDPMCEPVGPLSPESSETPL